MHIINNYKEFEQYLGREFGQSQWHKITQEQINKFADATFDHQWIHIDQERALKEGPFNTTIAHGYLTLSLTPYLWKQIVEIRNLKMEINYGIENLRFGQPVAAGSEVRLHVRLAAIKNLRGTTKANMAIKLDIKGEKKPAFTAEVVFLYHFEN